MMDLKHGVHLRMQQQLVMTPRLQMALKILQVSTLELEQFLKQELLQNPLLERLEEEEAELEEGSGRAGAYGGPRAAGEKSDSRQGANEREVEKAEAEADAPDEKEAGSRGPRLGRLPRRRLLARLRAEPRARRR